MMYIFTDGSTKKNGSDKSIGGYGVVLMDSICLHVLDCYAETNVPNTTNNRMELTAILAANVIYKTIANECAIFTDSSYAKNCLEDWWRIWEKNGWKTASGTSVKNKDIIKEYLNVINYSRGISTYLVKGHSGLFGNELADKLATGILTCEEVMKKYGKKEN